MLESVHDVMDEVRSRTLRLVEHLDEERRNAVLSPIMSPLSWDLGHVAAYEDLWLNHRAAGRPLLREDLAALYDAFETPRAVRGDLEFLRGAELREYMDAVRERALEAPVERAARARDPARAPAHRDDAAGDGAGRSPAAVVHGPATPSPAPGWRWSRSPRGRSRSAAPPEGFAYDNERPRHTASTARFTIARTPVTNATWLTFAEGGGYERREWWSDEGWAWKEEYDITHHAAAEAGERDAPVVHVSWFEAAAFARAHDARLPTEIEWEKAATWGQLEGTGEVWEWTSSHFTGYPGFVAHPYREYSEVFFGDRYRVLRGGSCATHPRVASPQFRNWDLPERRQLFAGVRIAR